MIDISRKQICIQIIFLCKLFAENISNIAADLDLIQRKQASFILWRHSQFINLVNFGDSCLFTVLNGISWRMKDWTYLIFTQVIHFCLFSPANIFSVTSCNGSIKIGKVSATCFSQKSIPALEDFFFQNSSSLKKYGVIQIHEIMNFSTNEFIPPLQYAMPWQHGVYSVGS